MIAHNFNPGARKFDPKGGSMNNLQGNGTPHQVSAHLSPYLEARLLNLEVAHADLRGEVDTLKDLYHDLYNSFDKVKRHPWDTDPVQSRQSAMQFKQELEQLSREVRGSVNGNADEQKANDTSTSKADGSVRPHVRAASVTSHGSGHKSLLPHLRRGKQSGAVNGIAYVLRACDCKLFLLTSVVEPPNCRWTLLSTNTNLLAQMDRSTPSFDSRQCLQQLRVPHCLPPRLFRAMLRLTKSRPCLRMTGSRTTSPHLHHCRPASAPRSLHSNNWLRSPSTCFRTRLEASHGLLV